MNVSTVDDAAVDAAAAADEWVWPASCSALRHMESALRCLICGEFFHGPVVLPCSHTFCSECVRRFLQTRGATGGCCPECKQSCAPGELVPNRALEKVATLFRGAKPKLLRMVTQAPGHGGGNGNGDGDGDGGGGKEDRDAEDFDDEEEEEEGAREVLERLPLLSYSLMKDKEVRRLLESIGLRAVVKSREDIIQIHKEYVLLSNAQADSSHPKTAAQLREEVMRNHRARLQERRGNSGGAAFLRGGGGGGSGSVAGHGPTTAGAMAPQMQANFAKLAQQVRARQAAAKAAAKEGASKQDASKKEMEEEEEENRKELGVWRHVQSLKTQQAFYIHSRTHEIRVEPPAEFLVQQPPQQQQQQSEGRGPRGGGQAAVDMHEEERQDKGKPEATTIASGHDEGEVTFVGSSPAPLSRRSSMSTPLSTPMSTPVRSPASQRKRKNEGRPSSSPLASFFSQEIVRGTPTHANEAATARSGATDNGLIDGSTTLLSPTASTPTRSTRVTSFSPSSGHVVSEIEIVDVSTEDTQMTGDGAAATDTTLTAGDTTRNSSSKWDCPRCTLMNDASQAECEACNYQHRPARKKTKLPPPAEATGRSSSSGSSAAFTAAFAPLR